MKKTGREAAKPVGYGIAGYLALLLLIQGLAWPMRPCVNCELKSSQCLSKIQVKVNATLVLNFTRYQESTYLLSEPVPQQRVFTPMVNLSGALVSNQYSGPVQIEFSTELSTFYLSNEEKTVFSQVNMYDNVVLPSPQNFNLSIDISSKIVSKISSNLTVFVLISDEKVLLWKLLVSNISLTKIETVIQMMSICSRLMRANGLIAI